MLEELTGSDSNCGGNRQTMLWVGTLFLTEKGRWGRGGSWNREVGAGQSLESDRWIQMRGQMGGASAKAEGKNYILHSVSSLLLYLLYLSLT